MVELFAVIDELIDHLAEFVTTARVRPDPGEFGNLGRTPMWPARRRVTDTGRDRSPSEPCGTPLRPRPVTSWRSPATRTWYCDDRQRHTRHGLGDRDQRQQLGLVTPAPQLEFPEPFRDRVVVEPHLLDEIANMT